MSTRKAENPGLALRWIQNLEEQSAGRDCAGCQTDGNSNSAPTARICLVTSLTCATSDP